MKKTYNLFIMIVLLTSVAFAVPGTWRGYVFFNATAANDSNIHVYKNGVSVIKVNAGTTAEKENHYYIANVEGADGDTIYFKINGVNASQGTQSWSLGDHILNLSINLTATDGVCSYSSGCASGLTCYDSSCNIINDISSSGTCKSS